MIVRYLLKPFIQSIIFKQMKALSRSSGRPSKSQLVKKQTDIDNLEQPSIEEISSSQYKATLFFKMNLRIKEERQFGSQLNDKYDKQTNTNKSSLLGKQILIKNPSYTDKRKLKKDQSTLDNFLSDFKQSKYLKTTIVKNNKYRQLTLNDFKKNKGKQCGIGQ